MDRSAGHRLAGVIKADARAAYDRRRDELGPAVMRDLERTVLLRVIEREWAQQLMKLQILSERLRKRGLPHSEFIATYRKEGSQLYADMTARIKLHSVGFIYNLDAATS